MMCLLSLRHDYSPYFSQTVQPTRACPNPFLWTRLEEIQVHLGQLSVEGIAISCNPIIGQLQCSGYILFCSKDMTVMVGYPTDAAAFVRPRCSTTMGQATFTNPFPCSAKPTSSFYYCCLLLTVAQTETLTSHACSPRINFKHQIRKWWSFATIFVYCSLSRNGW